MKKILLFLLCILFNTSICNAATYISVNQHALGYEESNKTIGNAKIWNAQYELYNENNTVVSVFTVKGYRYNLPFGKYYLKEKSTSLGYFNNEFNDLLIETSKECPNISIEIIKKLITSDLTFTFNDELEHSIYLFDHNNKIIKMEKKIVGNYNINLIYDDYIIYVDGQPLTSYKMSDNLAFSYNNDYLSINAKIKEDDALTELYVKRYCYDSTGNLVEEVIKDSKNDIINDNNDVINSNVEDNSKNKEVLAENKEITNNKLLLISENNNDYNHDNIINNSELIINKDIESINSLEVEHVINPEEVIVFDEGIDNKMIDENVYFYQEQENKVVETNITEDQNNNYLPKNNVKRKTKTISEYTDDTILDEGIILDPESNLIIEHEEMINDDVVHDNTKKYNNIILKCGSIIVFLLLIMYKIIKKCQNI